MKKTLTLLLALLLGTTYLLADNLEPQDWGMNSTLKQSAKLIGIVQIQALIVHEPGKYSVFYKEDSASPVVLHETLGDVVAKITSESFEYTICIDSKEQPFIEVFRTRDNKIFESAIKVIIHLRSVKDLAMGDIKIRHGKFYRYSHNTLIATVSP